MPKFNLSIAAIVSLSVGLLFAAGDTASAQQKTKKLSYEEAWAVCQKDVQANVPPETTTSAGRHARGAACMKKYGYKLKQ